MTEAETPPADPTVPSEAMTANDQTPPDRLTIVASIFHQTPYGEPTGVDVRTSKLLKGSEQPYSRRMSVKQIWTPIDMGWIKKVGLLCISNNEGKLQTQQPTKEQRDQLQKKVLQIGVKVPQSGNGKTMWDDSGDTIAPFASISPGEAVYFPPIIGPGAPLMIRSEHESVTFTVTAISE